MVCPSNQNAKNYSDGVWAPKIVDYGYNGWISLRMEDKAISRNLAESHGGRLSFVGTHEGGACFLLTLLADRERVIVLTVHGPGAWFAANNAYIRALPPRFPNVAVVDWDKDGSIGSIRPNLPSPASRSGCSGFARPGRWRP